MRERRHDPLIWLNAAGLVLVAIACGIGVYLLVQFQREPGHVKHQIDMELVHRAAGRNKQFAVADQQVQTLRTFLCVVLNEFPDSPQVEAAKAYPFPIGSPKPVRLCPKS